MISRTRRVRCTTQFVGVLQPEDVRPCRPAQNGLSEGGSAITLPSPHFGIYAEVSFRLLWALWRGAGVVERARLENENGRKAIEGSNPSLSAEQLIEG